MLRYALALTLAVTSSNALAVSEQELNQLRLGLREYSIYMENEEIAKLSLSQQTEIFALLTSTSNRRTGSWLRTRQRLRFIIAKGEN